MKFELTRNYKLAFRLLNEKVILAAWLDWNRDRVVASIRKIHGVILINKNAAYLPTIYDDFEKQCNQFNIEFLIPEDEVLNDLCDRSRGLVSP